MRKWFIIGIMFSLVISLNGQDEHYLELYKGESELKDLFEQLYSDSLENPGQVLTRIQSEMPRILALPGAMEYPWDRLDNIGVKTSEDKHLRIFTWHVMDDPDNYRYFGYFQVVQKRGKLGVFPLLDNGKPQRGMYKLDQRTDDWYGKLYYGIVTKQVKRRTYYTLMGMDFNHSRSNIKFVEMMQIQRNKPQFVRKAFSNGKDVVDRVVLEYSDQVAISVRYDPMLDLIVYDHLVPLHNVYVNNYEFYGPDGSFDGLRFEDGTWFLVEDIDARLQH